MIAHNRFKLAPIVREYAIGLLFLLSCIGYPALADPGYDSSSKHIERLIDDLTSIDTLSPGVDPDDVYSGFIASEKPLKLQMGLLGPPVPAVPPSMRDIVRLGVAALPALIDHLSDGRPTRFKIKPDDPAETVGGTYFGTEYEPRHGRSQSPDPMDEGRRVKNGYTVKVGDICYVLIGQIVNRELIAVRYQPTMLVFINSPVESPQLVVGIKRDWGGLNAADHKAQLLADLRAGGELWYFAPALERLRFYYPDTYSGLSGVDLKKRIAFEADEASTRAGK
jgi:hypothetical protein